MEITIYFDFLSNQFIFWNDNYPELVGANAFALVFPGDEGEEHYRRCSEIGLRIYNAMEEVLCNGGHASFVVSEKEYAAMKNAGENSPINIKEDKGTEIHGYLNFPPY